MVTLRPAAERGLTRLEWLDSRHTFSFNRYYDRRYVQFRALRVINDDTIAPGGIFGMHPHEDMEILTYMLEGSLRHQDSTGAAGLIGPGEVQRMTAGTGIRHSEANADAGAPARLLQIWIHPERRGLAPGYEQKAFPAAALSNSLALIAAPGGPRGALDIHQDAWVYAARLDAGTALRHPLARGRGAWVQVARGTLELNGARLGAGDGAAVEDERDLELRAASAAEVLLFDLA